MNNLKKFCGLCGKATVKKEKDSFNQETGEKNFEMICPNERCVAGCEERGHIYPSRSFLESFWEHTCNRALKCNRCGHEDWGGFY